MEYKDQAIVETNSSEITTKFNWGAMALTFYFAIANRAWLGLLVLLAPIPIIGWIFLPVWAIISGFKGEEWALNNPNNAYRDEEEFRKVMDGWNRAGLVAFIIGAVGIVLLIIFYSVIFAMIFQNIDQGGYNY